MKPYTLPPLPYSFDALEPYVDAATMKIHHDAHHKTYVDKLNEAIAKHPEWNKPVPELLVSLDKIPADIRTAVTNHAGGHANHTLYWTVMAPKSNAGAEPSGELLSSIKSQFGDYAKLREKFNDTAAKHFSNGWTWLCADKTGKFTVKSTADHVSPISEGLQPLLVLDVWEHAYYLKHQNKRPAYIETFWNVVNWKEVGMRFDEIKAKGSTTREWGAGIENSY